MSDEAWIDSVVESWAADTESSFSARGLFDPEMDVALRGTAEAIRQVLAAAGGSPAIDAGMSNYTQRPE